MVRYVDSAPFSMDLTAALNYNKVFEFGVAYRLDEGFGGFAIFNLTDSFDVGYAYEAPLSSALNNTDNGTHELFLKLGL